MKKLDVKDLMSYFSETDNITYLRLKQEGVEIELEKGAKGGEYVAPTQVRTQVAQEVVVPAIESELVSSALTIKSPMVGTFYKAPAPGSKPFVKVGDKISKGQTVAIIEAMKIMNEIEAEYDCEIKKILVDDAEPVEFDMPLFEVEKI